MEHDEINRNRITLSLLASPVLGGLLGTVTVYWLWLEAMKTDTGLFEAFGFLAAPCLPFFLGIGLGFGLGAVLLLTIVGKRLSRRALLWGRFLAGLIGGALGPYLAWLVFSLS